MEDMTQALVPPVPPLRVVAVELLHRAGEVGVGSGDREVVMVSHLTVRVAAKGVALHDVGEQRQEPASVHGVQVNTRPTHAARRDVVGQSRGLDAERARHPKRRFTRRASVKSVDSFSITMASTQDETRPWGPYV